MERCFKLATSIDLHIASAAGSREKAVAGVTTGLIGEGESVTWQGRHFGLTLRHRSRIDAWRPYSHFRDIMVEGVFAHFEHDHHFAPMDDGTRMRDEIHFAVPWGALGRLAARHVVRKHLAAMLLQRNQMIKRVAESAEWHKYLDGRAAIKLDTGIRPGLAEGWEKMKLV